LWDHLARSLVQVALAVGSVGVAFLLFEQQMQQMDRRAVRQQALAASATLRAVVRRLAEEFETQPQLYSVAYRFDCDQAACAPTPVEARYLDFYREMLDKPAFPAPASAYTAELRQLTHANFAFSDRAIELLLRQMQAFEFGTSAVRRDVDTLRRDRGRAGSASPGQLAKAFLKLARLQKDNADVAHALACRLLRSASLLEAGPEPPENGVGPYLSFTEPRHRLPAVRRRVSRDRPMGRQGDGFQDAAARVRVARRTAQAERHLHSLRNRIG
jgi:hypothetical protein